MTRTTATFSISLPPDMAKELDRIQKAEHRTRSELVREALRTYIRQADRLTLAERMTALPEEAPTPDESEAVSEGNVDFHEGRHVTLKQLRHDLHRSSR